MNVWGASSNGALAAVAIVAAGAVARCKSWWVDSGTVPLVIGVGHPTGTPRRDLDARWLSLSSPSGPTCRTLITPMMEAHQRNAIAAMRLPWLPTAVVPTRCSRRGATRALLGRRARAGRLGSLQAAAAVALCRPSVKLAYKSCTRTVKLRTLVDVLPGLCVRARQLLMGLIVGTDDRSVRCCVYRSACPGEIRHVSPPDGAISDMLLLQPRRREPTIAQSVW